MPNVSKIRYPCKKLDYLLGTKDTSYTVYKLVFPNGKSYVGVTKRKLSERWSNGRGYEKNVEMYQEIQRIGWECVQKIVIKHGLSKCDAECLETQLIKELGLSDPNKGYNKHFSFSPYLTKGQQVNQWKKENRDTLRIDLPKGMKAEIQSEAKKRGCSVTDLIQRALISYCSDTNIK